MYAAVCAQSGEYLLPFYFTHGQHTWQVTSVALEFQARLTSAFRQGSDSSMIGVTTTIKDNLTDTLFFRTLRDQLANFAGQGHLAVIRNEGQRLNRRPGAALLGLRECNL